LNHNLKKGRKIPRSISYSVLFLFVIVLISSVSAVAVYKQWEAVEIRHPIRLDGAANSVITANITVKDPDNNILINFAPFILEVASQEHNITVPAGKNGVLGVYPYCVTATGNGQNSTECFEYKITPSGDEGLITYYFLIIILSYGVLGLGLFKRDITITMLGTFALYFVGIWILFFGIDVFKNFLTEGFAILTLAVAFYISARAAHEYIVD